MAPVYCEEEMGATLFERTYLFKCSVLIISRVRVRKTTSWLIYSRFSVPDRIMLIFHFHSTSKDSTRTSICGTKLHMEKKEVGSAVFSESLGSFKQPAIVVERLNAMWHSPSCA